MTIHKMFRRLKRRQVKLKTRRVDCMKRMFKIERELTKLLDVEGAKA